MRFSDLKKKFPSLGVSVLVIAAFALLGSMMLPSISEKMGLNESSCLAATSGVTYGDLDDCIDECSADHKTCIYEVRQNCEGKFGGDSRWKSYLDDCLEGGFGHCDDTYYDSYECKDLCEFALGF